MPLNDKCVTIWWGDFLPWIPNCSRHSNKRKPFVYFNHFEKSRDFFFLFYWRHRNISRVIPINLRKKSLKIRILLFPTEVLMYFSHQSTGAKSSNKTQKTDKKAPNCHLPGVPTSLGHEFHHKSLNVMKGEKFVKVCLHSS